MTDGPWADKNKAPAGFPVGPCQSRPDGQEVTRPCAATACSGASSSLQAIRHERFALVALQCLIRFSATDAGTNGIVEAGFDDVRVTLPQ